MAQPRGLQGGRKEADGRKAARRQLRHQRVNRGKIGGCDIAAIERHRHARACLQGCGYIGADIAVQIPATIGHGFGPQNGAGVNPCRQCHLRQRRLRGHCPARIAQVLQLAQSGNGQGR